MPGSWHRLLTLFLWTLPHLLLGVLAVILYVRRLYREFPVFYTYVLYEIGEFVLLLLLGHSRSVTEKHYLYAYSATLLLSIALRFGVIHELSRDLFRESPFLKTGTRLWLRCVTALLLVASVLLAIYAPGDSTRWYAGVSVVNRGVAMVQCGLLLALLLFSRFLGVSWRRPAFGITLGLGILTSLDLAMYALRAEFTSEAGGLLDWLTTGTYLVCVSIWIGYSRVPEREPAPFAILPPTVLPNEEVETWNTELQRLLRD